MATSFYNLKFTGFLMTTINKILIKVLLLAPLCVHPTTAKADFSGWLKGCLIVGSMGIGGTVLGASVSKVNIESTGSLAVSGVLSCLAGGYLNGDLHKKAEISVKGELSIKNYRLKNSIYGVMHDLCVIKNTCGPDGLTSVEGYRDAVRHADKSSTPNQNDLFRPRTGN